MLHLHCMWLFQPVNSSRQGSVFLNLGSNGCCVFHIEEVSLGVFLKKVTLNGFALSVKVYSLLIIPA